MAPRRKRAVLDDSDSEEEKAREHRKTSLRNFFSPNGKTTAANLNTSPSAARAGPTTPLASPTPIRRRKTDPDGDSPTKASSNNADDANSTASPVVHSPFGQVLSNRLKDNNTNGHGVSNGKTPCSSPEKKRSVRGLKGQADEKGKSADLVTLFTKQAEKAQNSPPKKTTVSQRPASHGDDITSDPIISDDGALGDDDEIADNSAVAASYVGNRAQKRWKHASQTFPSRPSGAPSQPQTLPAPGSQKFRRPVQPNRTNGALAADADDDLRPWSERFAPTNLDELAVHKKKVTDVRRWLEDVLQGRMRQRLLILKGAAGTGKTSTVRLLAKDMGLDILEWRNPTGASTGGASSLGFASTAVQFDEFLNRGSRFTQLDLDDAGSESDDGTEADKGPPGAASSLSSASHHAKARRRRKIIVIEEFPNTFMRSSSVLTGFRNTVLQYLATNTPSLTSFAQSRGAFDVQNIAPVVMVISETLLTTTSASADSFTAHRLLGPEILRHPGTGLIEFNAIAPSLLAKALELVVQKEARKSGRRRTPGPQVLRRLGEVGDIRSAVASLEFLCVKGDNDGDWGAKVAFTKGRKGPKDAALTKGERETLEMVSQREASLGVFHAVGKVVYNKRDDLPLLPGSEEALAEVLPDYLSHHARPKHSLVAVDTLIDETGTDTHTFISALHENYALSCEQTGPLDPLSSIDYINGCIEYLSESDLLCPTWDIFFGGRGTSRFNYGRDSGSHVLRQDEMAFQVAVRGLLFSLPSPVKRSSANHYQRAAGSSDGVGGRQSGGGDQFKMFYPMSLKLWRSREELEGLVDIWATKLLRGEMTLQKQPGSIAQPTQQVLTNRALAFRRPPKFGNSSQMANNQTATQLQQEPANPEEPVKREEKDDDCEESASVLLSLGSSARNEMLLERLPYMALMARGKKKQYCSFGSPAMGLGVRELEKVVSFHGIGAPDMTAEDDDGEDDGAYGGGSSFVSRGAGADEWATDKPTDDASPRKARKRRPLSNSRGTAPTRTSEDADLDSLQTGLLPMYKLVLSDDDIEDVD